MQDRNIFSILGRAGRLLAMVVPITVAVGREAPAQTTRQYQLVVTGGVGVHQVLEGSCFARS